MDPRVLAHYGGDLTRVNVQPSKTDKVARRYGTSLAGGSGSWTP
jgi:alkane 1-monooxygenase